jgi:predicted ATP-grasp superfamily ATP-dependent carboligase
MDLVRPLGLAGIGCAAVAGGDDAIRFSRFTRALEARQLWDHPGAQVQALLRFAESTESPPVLLYQGDPDTLMISRHRDVLGERFRFVIAGATLVEDLVDKARFVALAQPARASDPAVASPAAGGRAVSRRARVAAGDQAAHAPQRCVTTSAGAPKPAR